MTERRYGTDEMREIFSLATTGDAREQALPVEANGFTIAELQRIGAEAGIDPARVAVAARSLNNRGAIAPVTRSFGMPVGVSRVVPLPRAPNDREWEQLVSQFRTTFAAHGSATTSGGMREWSNGNLHISVEPTAHGEQLRLVTRNEAVVAVNGVATVLGAMAVVVSAVAAGSGEPVKALTLLGIFGGISLTGFATNFFRAPAWVRRRDAQFADIAEHTVKLLSDHGE